MVGPRYNLFQAIKSAVADHFRSYFEAMTDLFFYPNLTSSEIAYAEWVCFIHAVSGEQSRLRNHPEKNRESQGKGPVKHSARKIRRAFRFISDRERLLPTDKLYLFDQIASEIVRPLSDCNTVAEGYRLLNGEHADLLIRRTDEAIQEYLRILKSH